MSRQTGIAMRRSIAVALLAIIVMGGLAMVPAGSGEQSCPVVIDRPFTAYEDPDYHCDVTVSAKVTVPAGATLTVTDSTLDIGDGGLINVLSGGTVILESTVHNGTPILVEPGGTFRQYVTVQVQVTGPGMDPGNITDVWAWPQEGDKIGPVSLDGTDSTSLHLLVRSHDGASAPVEHFPWRIVARNATAVNQTIMEVPPQQPGSTTVEVEIPVDDDNDPPAWTEAPDITTTDGDHIADSTAVLTWGPADDSDPVHTNRAIDHYEVRHTTPGGRTIPPMEVGAVANPTAMLQTALTDLQAGLHVFEVRAIDLAGNAGPYSDEAQIIVDMERPTIQWRISPPLPSGLQGWYDQQPTVGLEATDTGGSGMDKITYRLGSVGVWASYEGTFPITSSGDHLLQVRAADKAGNTAEKSIRIPVDLDGPAISMQVPAPSASAGWHDASVQVSVDATDSVSGVASLAYQIDAGTWNSFQDTLVVGRSGAHELRVRATDRAGNTAEVTEVISIDTTAPFVPRPIWSVLEDGRVRVDWRNEPPTDAVSGIHQVFVERGTASGDVVSRIEASANETVHEVGPYPIGQHQFRISVQDMAGNTANSAWAKLPIERSTAGLMSLTDNQRVRGVVSLGFQPTGEFTPDEVRFYVDDVLIATTTDAGEAVMWDTTQHRDGLHDVRIVALSNAGGSQEQLQSLQVRNGYGATIADHMALVIIAALLAAVAGGLGVFGLDRWRDWQVSHDDHGSKHALSKHNPSHRTFETAKMLHLIALIAAAVMLVALFGLPALAGTHTIAATAVGVLIPSGLLVLLQGALLAFLWTRKRRITSEPHLRRHQGHRLSFDADPRTHASPEPDNNPAHTRGDHVQFRQTSGDGR